MGEKGEEEKRKNLTISHKEPIFFTMMTPSKYSYTNIIAFLLSLMISLPLMANETELKVVLADSCGNIYHSLVEAAGRFSQDDRIQFVQKSNSIITVMDFAKGSARQFAQFIVKGEIFNFKSANINNDPQDELMFLERRGELLYLAIWDYYADPPLSYLLVDKVCAKGDFDLDICVLENVGKKSLVCAARTYRPNYGPRLLFGVELDSALEISWIKRSTESFEFPGIVLPTKIGQIAVYGGYVTLNTLVYDGKAHYDTVCVLRAVTADGEEIARLEKHSRNYDKPAEPGYLHCYVQPFYNAAIDSPMIAALWGTKEYSKTKGLLTAYYLEVDNKRWVELAADSLRIDHALFALPSKSNCTQNFLSNSQDSLYMKVVKYDMEKRQWSLPEGGGQLSGELVKVFALQEELGGIITVQKRGNFLDLAGWNCQNESVCQKLYEFPGESTFFPLYDDNNRLQEAVIGVNETEGVEKVSPLPPKAYSVKAYLLNFTLSPVEKETTPGKPIIFSIAAGFVAASMSLIIYRRWKKTKNGGKWVLPPEIEKRIRDKLFQAMEVEEIFCSEDLEEQNTNFNLEYLASALKEKKHHLSYVINKEYRNFTEFAHKHCVKKAQALLSDKKCDRYSLDAIGHKAGFRSTSAFYKVFSKFTGMTPKQWRENHKKDLSE